MKNKNNEKIVNICSSLLENGAEISRAEDTAKRLLKAQGYKDVNVFCISSVIIIHADGETFIRRITKSDINLSEIDRLNSMSRAMCLGEKITKTESSYNVLVKITAVSLGCAAYCVYFGGSIREALLAAVIGNIINFRRSFLSPSFAKVMTDSFIAGALSLLCGLIIKKLDTDKIMTGTIMLLVPGITTVNGVRDIMKADIISGLIELTEAVFTALAISLGYSAARLIC